MNYVNREHLTAIPRESFQSRIRWAVPLSSVLSGLGFFLLGSLSDLWLQRHLGSLSIALIDDALVGIGAGLLVFLYVTERRVAEDRRFRYAAIVESSDDAIVGTDLRGTVTHWNKGAERLFGYSAGEAIGKDISFMRSEDRSEEGLANLKKVIGGEVVRPYETVCQRKDGTLVGISLRISPIVDAKGRIAGASGIARDVTERKLAEQELLQTNERLNLSVEAGRIGGWEVNFINGTSFWFGQTHAMLGISSTVQAASQEFWDRVHQEDRDWLQAALQESMRNHTELTAEFRVVWPDGSVHWLRSQGRFFYGVDGQAERILGISVDITEHKRAEEALRESEERLRLAQWAAHIGTFDLNMRTGVDIWTPETEALYGLPPGGFGGTLADFENLIHPEDRERITELSREMLKTGKPTEAEWRVVWPDGSVHWIAGRGQVFMDESGEPARMLGVSMDITERKRAEETISGMTRKLIEAQEQERARIARELHDDISQHLAVLATELNQLQEKHEEWPPDVHRQILELQQMTADICSSVYGLSYELHSSTLDLLGLSKGMSSWCKTFGERQNMEIDFQCHDVPELPQEISLWLFRVLQEAVHNAAKHSGVKRIEVQLQKQSGQIHLIVSDSGKGFDLEAVRLSRGLGLTSMQERVRLVGGTMTIQSRAMGGTTIQARVPLGSKERSQRATV